MALNPVIVNQDLSIVRDGVTTRLQRGTLLDMTAGMGSSTTYVPPGTTNNAANLSTRVTSLTAQQQVPGSSDSVNAAALENLTGGGVDPYNAGQAG